MALTLNIAKCYFWMIQQSNLFTRHSSLWTCTVKLSWTPQKISRSEHIIETLIFDCMNRNSVTVTLTFKIETHFSHMTLWFIMMSHHNGSVMHKISSKLTLTETFNLGCDSNPTFSLDTSLLMMIYTQIEFGCKRLTGLELIKDIVETVIFWLYKPTLWPWPWR